MAYTPTTWATGDKITSTKMNKLEQGVADAGEGVFAATYGTTTYSAISAAVQAGKKVICKRLHPDGRVIVYDMVALETYRAVFGGVYDGGIVVCEVSGDGWNNGLYSSVPQVTVADNGKFLRVVNGAWAAATVNSAEPHNYAFDGANLLDVFADADALWAALSQEDYSHIHLGDYYPVTLNGSYRDYGSMTCQTGQKYYTDTNCIHEAGTAAQDYAANPVLDSTLPDSHKAYCEVTISGTKYYCKYAECLPYKVNTLSNAIMKFEAMPNHYWRYGDSGALNFQNGKTHILFSPRDGLPTTLKMRKTNETWEETTVDEFTGDGTTAEFTLTGTVGTIGYVFVDGAKKTYNTDYTYASNKITFNTGKIPANNTTIKVEWMAGTTPWNGSALYRTFNDPDYGIIKLIQQADAKLYNHIYKGPNAKGMRYYGETRTKTNQQGGGWFDRGLLFLPTEDEIWGRPMHSASGLNVSTQQQQWPLYAGGRRHFAKGAGNGASRSGGWVASSAGVSLFAFVGSYGNPSNSNASNAYAVAPCFIFCEAPSA